jgi:hypothetical protein
VRLREDAYFGSLACSGDPFFAAYNYVLALCCAHLPQICSGEYQAATSKLLQGDSRITSDMSEPVCRYAHEGTLLAQPARAGPLAR